MADHDPFADIHVLGDVGHAALPERVLLPRPILVRVLAGPTVWFEVLART
jgi:hypothetical protein